MSQSTGHGAQLGTIGILGGTGPQGRGLASRLARAGQHVILGSRDASRAEAAAAEIGYATIGADNASCAAAAAIVIVAVPWDAHSDTIISVAPALAGKIVVDCVNPLAFDKNGAYVLNVPEGSAAEQAASLLPASTVVGAFHHLSAVLLLDAAVPSLDTDVFVVGDDRTATDTVAVLAAQLPGVRGIYAGRLRNAGQVEGLTANLISVNRRYKAHAGVRVTDVEVSA